MAGDVVSVRFTGSASDLLDMMASTASAADDTASKISGAFADATGKMTASVGDAAAKIRATLAEVGDTDSPEELRAKFAELADTLDGSMGEAMDKFSADIEAGMERAAAATDAFRDQYTSAMLQLDVASKEAAKVADETDAEVAEGTGFKDAAASAGNLFMRLGSLTSGLPIVGEAFKKMGEQIADADTQGGKVVATLSAIGKTAVFAGVTGLAVVAFESVKAASSFQSAMEMLHTQAGVAQSSIAGLSKSVLDMAGSVATTPDQLAESLYHLASNGLRGQQALDALRIAAEGAKVGQSDLVDTTNALGAVIAAKMVPGLHNYAGAMAEINAAVGSGDMHMQDFAEALGTGVLASVRTYGVTLNDVSAALATFGDNNIRGAKAGTDLRMAVQALAVPVKAGQEALKAMGYASGSLTEQLQHGGLRDAIDSLNEHMQAAGITGKKVGEFLTMAFGKKAGVGLAVLESELGRFNDKFGLVARNSGTFGKDFAATSQTLKFQLEQIQAAVEALGVKFGEWLTPKLEEAAAATAKVVEWFEKHLGVAEALAAVIGGVLTAAITTWLASMAVEKIQAVGEAISGLVGGFQVLTGAEIEADAAADANPVGAVIVGIAALSAAIYELATHWQQVTAFIKKYNLEIAAGLVVVMGPIGVLLATATEVAEHWRGAWTAIQAVVGAVSAGLAPIVGFIEQQIGALTAWWNAHWSEIRQIAEAVWGPIRTAVSVAWSVITAEFHAAMDVITAATNIGFQAIKGVFDVGLTVIETAWTVAWDAVRAAVEAAWDIIRGVVTAAVAAVETVIDVGLAVLTGHWSQAWNALQAGVTNVMHAIVSMMQGALGAMSSAAAAIGSAILNGIVNAANQAAGAVNNVLRAVVSSLGSLAGSFFSAAASLGSQIVSGIVSGIESAGGAVLHAIESLIPGGGLVGKAAHILGLAEGGIVTKPTLAVIGEGGYPEAVIPLRNGLTADASGVTALPGTSGTPTTGTTKNGGTYDITQYFMTPADAASIANELSWTLGRLA